MFHVKQSSEKKAWLFANTKPRENFPKQIVRREFTCNRREHILRQPQFLCDDF